MPEKSVIKIKKHIKDKLYLVTNGTGVFKISSHIEHDFICKHMCWLLIIKNDITCMNHEHTRNTRCFSRK